MALILQTLICSTRPGRVGPTVAHWFHEVAAHHGKFEAALVDIADFGLPLYDERYMPVLKKYEKDHTKRWSESVEAADAFVFVTPEYNAGPPPSLVNALSYLFREWNYKPCAFCSYGGASGGVRAAQAEKLLATTLKMAPISESVVVSRVPQLIDAEGHFKGDDALAHSATRMLDELHKWATALKPMRAAP